MIYYRVSLSGKNYLDKDFQSLEEAQKYAADLGFTVCAGSSSNFDYMETLYYIEDGDDLSNYVCGYEPCIIEEKGEKTATVLCLDYGWSQGAACYIAEENEDLDAEEIDAKYVCKNEGDIYWSTLNAICEERGISESFEEEPFTYPSAYDIKRFFDRNDIWFIDIDESFILKRKLWDAIDY